MDRIFWFSVPAKADSNNFLDFFLEIFYFQKGDGQTAQCVLGKQCYIAGKYQMDLLKPTYNCFDNSQETVSMNEGQPVVCLTLPPTSIADVGFV